MWLLINSQNNLWALTPLLSRIAFTFFFLWSKSMKNCFLINSDVVLIFLLSLSTEDVRANLVFLRADLGLFLIFSSFMILLLETSLILPTSRGHVDTEFPTANISCPRKVHWELQGRSQKRFSLGASLFFRVDVKLCQFLISFIGFSFFGDVVGNSFILKDHSKELWSDSAEKFSLSSTEKKLVVMISGELRP